MNGHADSHPSKDVLRVQAYKAPNDSGVLTPSLTWSNSFLGLKDSALRQQKSPRESSGVSEPGNPFCSACFNLPCGISCLIPLKRERLFYSSTILPVTPVWKLEVLPTTTKKNSPPENLFGSLMAIFPTHHGEHRCQISGCQTCVSQELSFPAGHSQDICSEEFGKGFSP